MSITYLFRKKTFRSASYSNHRFKKNIFDKVPTKYNLNYKTIPCKKNLIFKQMAVQAWKTLSSGVLNSSHSDTVNVLTRLPDLDLNDDFTYDPKDVNKTWDLIVMALNQDPDIASQETFRFKQNKICF